jgi:hypothetical protein
MVNRIAHLLAQLYGGSSAQKRAKPGHSLRANEPVLTRSLRRRFAPELRSVRAILVEYVDVEAHIVGIEEKPSGSERASIVIQVRATPSGRKSGVLDGLKLAFAAAPALENVRIVLFNRPPKPRRRRRA